MSTDQQSTPDPDREQLVTIVGPDGRPVAQVPASAITVETGDGDGSEDETEHGVASLVELGIPVTMPEVDHVLRQRFESVFGPTKRA